MFQCMESHWGILNKNACQFLSKIQRDTTEPSLLILSWCCLDYFGNSASFCLKIMDSCAVQNSLPPFIGNAHQNFHLMEAHKKISPMVQKHSTTNSAWMQPASITGACFPSPVISPFCQLIFGKCPLVPWMYSRACAWPDVLYWLSLTPALWVQPPDHRSLLCSRSVTFWVLKIFSSRWICTQSCKQFNCNYKQHQMVHWEAGRLRFKVL